MMIIISIIVIMTIMTMADGGSGLCASNDGCLPQCLCTPATNGHTATATPRVLNPPLPSSASRCMTRGRSAP
jgi:hypothetical protein